MKKNRTVFGNKCEDCDTILNEGNVRWVEPWRRHFYKACKNCLTKRYAAQKRNNNFKSNYGITQREFNLLNEIQQEHCAICRRKCTKFNRLSVDHDHETGQVRGLLCHKCNTAVAMLEENENF